MDRVFENPLRVVDMGQTDDDVLVAVSPVDRTVSEDEALSPRPDRAQLAVRPFGAGGAVAIALGCIALN